jgi:hypothetical protein
MRRFVLATSLLTIFGGGYTLLKPTPAAAAAGPRCCIFLQDVFCCGDTKCEILNDSAVFCY